MALWMAIWRSHPKSLSIADARNPQRSFMTKPGRPWSSGGERPVAMIVSVREFEMLAGARGSFATAPSPVSKGNDLRVPVRPALLRNAP